ncbi:glycoprotein precursor, partial [Mothra virus]
CEHNEGNESCRSKAVPILLGISIALGIVVVLLPILLIIDYKCHIFNRMRFCHKETKKVKEMKRAEALAKLLAKYDAKMLQCKSQYKDQDWINDEGPEGIEMNPLNHQNESWKPTPAPRSPKADRSSLNLTKAALLTLALQSTLTPVQTCDDVLFMSATGGIYHDQQFENSATSLVILHAGSTLCLKYPSGSQEMIKMSEMSRVIHYSPIYKACNFSLDVRSYYDCLGNWPCWEKSSCNVDTKFERVGPKAYKLPSGRESCELVPNLSNSKCTHEQICIWYYWDVVPELNSCDLIYKEVSTSNLAHIEHTDTLGNTIPFVLSDESPFIDSPLRMHLMTLTPTLLHPPTNKIRQHQNDYYFTDASERSMGRPGVLGDYQMSLSSNGTFFPDWAVQCKPDGDKMACMTSTPGYVRSLQIDKDRPVSVSRTTRAINVVSKTRGYGSFMIRMSSKPDQLIIAASCSFRIDYRYGCTGCTDRAFIVVSATDIQTTGAMQFTSNCSFVLPEVFCSSQPQRLEINDSPSACSLKIKGTNQTLDFPLQYEFRGEVFSGGIMTFRAVESSYDKFLLGISSPSFLTSLHISLGVGVVSSVIIAILKASTRYTAFKVGKTEVKE